MKLAIIGGGASGLIAAITAANQGAEVTIFEKNDRIGKKILATGNGKCNITNLYQDIKCYHSSKPDFVMEILNQFPVTETISFLRLLV
jgi:predicted flavoprotein YhiN